MTHSFAVEAMGVPRGDRSHDLGRPDGRASDVGETLA